MITKQTIGAKTDDLTGKHYGMLTVTEYAGKDKNGLTMWECLCKCGESSIVRSHSLKAGTAKSCGCQQNALSHGMTKTPEYRAYQDAKDRCTNAKNAKYPTYGARGIKFLFNSFEEFIAHIGPRPECMTLDRENNNGNYELGNVRWATRSQQMSNRNPYHRKFRPRNEVAKQFVVVTPTLEKLSVTNLAEFCRQKALSLDMLYRSTKTNIAHRGYSAQHA